MNPPASEIPNWFSLVIQTGSFGLIAYFIIKILPKAMERLFQVHLRALDTFRQEQKELRDVFQKEVNDVRTHADARMALLAESLKISTKETTQTLKASVDTIQHIVEKQVANNHS